MNVPEPLPEDIPPEVERKLKRLSVILAAQLPGDSIHAMLTIRYMADIVQGYVEPGKVIQFRNAPVAS
jgi:hypothetical protein